MTTAIADSTTTYQRAIEALRGGEFSSAEEQLLVLLDEGGIDANVFHALGNSYYRQEKWGLAYGAYRQGLSLSPRNSDLHDNISLTAEQLQIDSPSIGMFSVEEYWLMTSFWTSVMFGALLLQRWRGHRLVAIGAAIAMVGSLILSKMERNTHSQAVVIEETYVRSRVEKGMDLYSINIGEQVTLIERDNEYWLVEHSVNGKGWISAKMIAGINPYTNYRREKK